MNNKVIIKNNKNIVMPSTGKPYHMKLNQKNNVF